MRFWNAPTRMLRLSHRLLPFLPGQRAVDTVACQSQGLAKASCSEYQAALLSGSKAQTHPAFSRRSNGVGTVIDIHWLAASKYHIFTRRVLNMDIQIK